MPKVIYLLLSVVTAAHCNQYLPPALVWGNEINAPPGQVQATPENVAGTIPSENIVVFMLDKLSLEDFAKFDTLKKIVTDKKSVFFPEVESVELIEYLSKHKKNVEIKYLDSVEDVELAVSKVNFDKKVGMLTARQSSWRSPRTKRATSGPFYPDSDSLIHLSAVDLAVSHNGESHSVQPQDISIKVTPNESNTTVLFTFVGGSSPKLTVTHFSLEMILRRRGGYYTLGKVTAVVNATLAETGGPVSVNIDEELRSTVDLLYPVSSSFHCTKFGPMRASLKPKAGNSTASVTFNRFQIQVGKNATDKFLPVYECVGFFTPGIWMGIFMNLILISIITWGIYMIMSVKTMDRFDDPKGKPISFAGSD